MRNRQEDETAIGSDVTAPSWWFQMSYNAKEDETDVGNADLQVELHA